MARDDWKSEGIRRNNIAAKLKAKKIIFAGLPDNSHRAFKNLFPQEMIINLNSSSDLYEQLSRTESTPLNRLKWGRDNIGVGLLKALREGSVLELYDDFETNDSIDSKSGHLVVCEAGEPISELIAANYAFSLRAGLKIIPEFSKESSERLLESFYSLYNGENQSKSQTDNLTELRNEIRSHCEDVNITNVNSITFISKNLPLGFGFPELPTTHLFSYPDLGLAVANGLVAEQPRTRGTNTTLLIDPGQTNAPEIEAIAQNMAKRGAFVRGYYGPAAHVKLVSDTIELYPYDLLIFATHCGDAPGHRWTYEFQDSEGRCRNLVVDIAVGIGSLNQDDKVEVQEHIRFHKLDGIDWNDPDKSIKLHVGTAIRDFSERFQNDDDFKPISKELIDRVIGSAALKMFDSNYLAMPQSIACNRSPIIINNACGSWHNLASRFIYAGSRGYLGTLFDVTDYEAEAVLENLIVKQWGKTLPHAIWSSQNAIYGNNPRRPYLFTGVYCSKLRVTKENVPEFLANSLKRELRGLKKIRSDARKGNSEKRVLDRIKFVQDEIKHLSGKYHVI